MRLHFQLEQLNRLRPKSTLKSVFLTFLWLFLQTEADYTKSAANNLEPPFTAV
jgi:hypothetical protein